MSDSKTLGTLKNDFLKFQQNDWNRYIENIIYKKSYSPEIPEIEDEPALVLLSLYNILLELNIDMNGFKNSIIYNYNRIEKTGINADAIGALISISGFAKPDLEVTFKKDLEQRLLAKMHTRQGRNLHVLLINILSKYNLNQGDFAMSIVTCLHEESIRIDQDEYDLAVLNYFLTTGFENYFFEYLNTALIRADSSNSRINNIVYSIKKHLFLTHDFRKIIEWLSGYILDNLNFPSNTFNLFKSKFESFLLDEIEMKRFPLEDLNRLKLLINGHEYELIEEVCNNQLHFLDKTHSSTSLIESLNLLALGWKTTAIQSASSRSSFLKIVNLPGLNPSRIKHSIDSFIAKRKARKGFNSKKKGYYIQLENCASNIEEAEFYKEEISRKNAKEKV